MTTDEVIRRDVLEKCRAMDIPLCGIADVDRWKTPLFTPWIPEEFHPASILPEARSVIVIGLPVTLPVLETSPSIWYHELYNTLNRLLDQYAYLLSEFLCEKGYSSVFIPRDGYGSIRVLLKNPVAFFSHRHAAFLAGLGTFGVNNMLLTPGYGPRVRFTSVFTSASLPADPVMEEQLCIRCMKCSDLCPAQALGTDDYPLALTGKSACARYSATLCERHISPCGICIKVCPVGNDRTLFSRQDTTIYDPPVHKTALQRSWDHVRTYGGL